MGVAPRWRTLTSMPTVTSPSSRLWATAFQEACSISAIIIGVPKTSTPPAPTDAAVFSWTTVVVDSPFMPSSTGIEEISSLSVGYVGVIYNKNFISTCCLWECIVGLVSRDYFTEDGHSQ